MIVYLLFRSIANRMATNVMTKPNISRTTRPQPRFEQSRVSQHPNPRKRLDGSLVRLCYAAV